MKKESKLKKYKGSSAKRKPPYKRIERTEKKLLHFRDTYCKVLNLKFQSLCLIRLIFKIKV